MAEQISAEDVHHVALVLVQMRHGGVTPAGEVRPEKDSRQAKPTAVSHRPNGHYNVLPPPMQIRYSRSELWPNAKLFSAPVRSTGIKESGDRNQANGGAEDSSSYADTTSILPTNDVAPGMESEPGLSDRQPTSRSLNQIATTPSGRPGKAARKQQSFDPMSTDSDYEKADRNSPGKMERFCKTLGYHFKEKLSRADMPDQLGEWRFEELEKYTSLFEPAVQDGLQIIKFDDDAFPHGVGSNSAEGLPIRGKHGLSVIECELCEYMGLRFDKYRCIKAQILFGFACIIEQNLRGCSGKLRTCHPFVRNVDRYRCVNLGPSQAQMLCRGVDVNITSRICLQFQLWNWLPDGEIMKQHDKVVTIAESAEKLFPKSHRGRLLAVASDWDLVAPLPETNKMTISDDDLVAAQTESMSCVLTCQCSVRATNPAAEHPVVSSFILPQKPAQIGVKRKVDAKRCM